VCFYFPCCTPCLLVQNVLPIKKLDHLNATRNYFHVADGRVRYGFGRDIFLGLNEDWKAPDADYTPYKNVLSAVWPKLHHRNYTWALIEIKTLDVTMYYKDDVPLLTDPCSHPDVIRCGKTGNISIYFLYDFYIVGPLF